MSDGQKSGKSTLRFPLDWAANRQVNEEPTNVPNGTFYCKQILLDDKRIENDINI